MKKQTIYSILVALLLAVVAFIFFAPDDFRGNVLQQHDIMQGLANGQEVQQYEQATGHAPRWTNALFGGMPTFQISPSYASSGLMGWIFSVYTLWLPSPANLLFALMLGFFIMCLCMKMRWTTALFAALAWGFSTYFIIIIGAGHIWKFVTLAYIPPTIGGMALLYRGRYLAGAAVTSLFASLQLMANHPQMTYYFLIPIGCMVVAWGVMARREKRMRRWCVATAIAIGAGALALAANSASLYNSYEYSKETVRGRATDIVTDTHDDTGGMDRDAITAWSYGIDETLTLLIPNVKGGATIKPVGGQNTLLSVADTDVANSAYLSPQEMQVVAQFGQYFGDQPMTNGPVYVGALVLMLAILAMFVADGPKATPLKWALFAALILSVMLAWGHNFPALTNFFIDHVPGYNKFRTPSSILVVLEFCVPLLAVLALKKMIDTPDFLSRYRWTLYTVFGLGAAICILGWLAPSTFGSPYSAQELSMLRSQGILTDPAYANVLATVRNARLSLVSADCARSLMYIVLGFLVIWLYLRGAFRNSTLFVCALSAVVLIDLFSINKRYVNSDNFVEPMPRTETFAENEADRFILQDTTDYRVLDLGEFGGARSSYFHKTIGGYHAAKLTRYNDLITYQISPAIARLNAEAKKNMARLQALEQDSTVNQEEVDTRIFTAREPVLDMLNTKYYLYGDYAEENPGALGNAWFVDRITYVPDANHEMEALSTIDPAREAVADASFRNILGEARAKAPGDTIYLTSYAPDRLKYRASSAAGGLALFSEVYFPWGWQVTVDGKEVEMGRADYTLRALPIPAGQHEVEFYFNPRSLTVTNNIGVAAVVVIFILCGAALTVWIVRLLRHRKEEPKDPERSGGIS
ncbi:MAG: YfhO family protein [Muribaculaceae bacterium]|nr:YfhO family protein [Muribaculaceae bacterium]